MKDNLSYKTDSAAQKECLKHIEPYVVGGRFLLYIFFILLFLLHALYFIHKSASFKF